MKYLVAFILVFAANLGHCEEPNAEYKNLVDEVLELTGGLAMGSQLSGLFIGEFLKVLKAGNNDVSDEVIAAVKEEITESIDESMENGDFHKMLYPIYAKHLSRRDLKAMAKFYKSKEGKRIVAVQPLLLQESVVAGQNWGAELGPQISERIQKRLEAMEHGGNQPSN